MAIDVLYYSTLQMQCLNLQSRLLGAQFSELKCRDTRLGVVTDK